MGINSYDLIGGQFFACRAGAFVVWQGAWHCYAFLIPLPKGESSVFAMSGVFFCNYKGAFSVFARALMLTIICNFTF